MADVPAALSRESLGSTGAEMGREISDQLLLERFLAHRDESAFAGLVHRHGRAVWGVCRRVLHQEQDVEDAFQAVFLVLARKAASIRKGEAVGCWLYGVAYRTAMKARQNAVRRLDAERQAAGPSIEPPPASEAACRELQRLLDEEVDRLAEKYRAPFILCCLEGMSRAEAARELGWKEGTLSGRLAQARKLLQHRLARRGVTLSAVLTAGALMQNTAAAAAPPILVGGTVKAVLTPAAGKTATTLSPSAVALAEGLMRTMAAAKVKGALALLLAATTLVAGASLAVLHIRPAEQGKPPQEAIVLHEPEMFVAPPVALFARLDERVLSLAFTPDGKKLVTAGALFEHAGQLKIWDVKAGKALVAIKGIPGVRSVVISPDGRTLATGDFSGAIRLRDGETGRELATTKAHQFGVNGVAFSRDGAFLASAGLDRTVKLWSVQGLKERKTFRGHSDMVLSVAVFTHGRTLVSGSRDGTARIWDVQTGKEKFLLKGHRSAVEAVAVSPDDKVVATASWDQTIKLWNAETGMETASFDGKAGSVLFVSFSPDGALLAGAGDDGTVRLWDVKTHQLVARLKEHSDSIWGVVFSRDGKFLASGSFDKTAKIWSVADKKLVATLVAAEQKPIQAIAYPADGRVAAVAAEDKTVQIRDAKTGDVRLVLNGHADRVTCLAFSPDGQSLAAGSMDKTIKIWDRATGREQQTLKGLPDGVNAVAYTPDGTKLASASAQTITWWDPNTGKELASLKGGGGAIRALAMSPEGRNLASGSEDGTIKVWEIAKPGTCTVLKGHTKTVRALAYSADGALASASEDATVKIWDQGRERHTLAGSKRAVLALTFTPGGRSLVSAGQDGNVYIWNPATAELRGVLKGQEQGVTALAVHPTGNCLLSGTRDHDVLRWNAVLTAIPPVSLSGNPGGVRFAQFSPAGDMLATGGHGGTVTLWTRTLSPAELPFRMREGGWRDAAFSPDGQTFATAGSNDVQVFDAVSARVKHTFGIGKGILSIAYSPDGRYLGAGTGDMSRPNQPAEVWLFDLATGEKLARMTDHQAAILRLQFSPDGKTLATSARDRSIRLWEVPSGKSKGVLRGHKGAARGLIFLPDGTLVSAGYDKTIRFWDVAAGKEKAVWDAGMGLASLDLSPDGTLLAAGEARAPGDRPAPLKIWDVAAGKVKLELKGHQGRIIGLSFTGDGRGLLVAGGQLGNFGEISYYDLTSGQLRGSHKTPRQWLERAALSHDGRRVLSPSAAGLYLWHLDFTHEERTWKAHNDVVNCGLFLEGGRVLATGGSDGVIHLWDVRKDGALIASLKGHGTGVCALAAGLDGNTLFSGGDGASIRQWDLAAGKERAAFQGKDKIASLLAVSADGKTLASVTGDGREPGALVLWDLETGKKRKTPSGVEALWSAAFSPDGKFLAGGTVKDVVKVWNLETGEVRATLEAPDCRFVAFSRDGKLLASTFGKAPAKAAPGAGGVRLWETATWKEQRPLSGHEHVVFTMDFSPGGEILTTASQDGTIKLWSVPVAGGVAPRSAAGQGPIPPSRNLMIGTGDASTPQGGEEVNSPQKKMWKIGLAVGGALCVMVLLSLALWRLLRSGRQEVERSKVNLDKDEPARTNAGSYISCRCSACGKSLKAKAALAGKKIRCPQCAQAVQVPPAS